MESIVTQLVALEKQPLKALESKATLVQGQISAMGTIQSEFSALADAAKAMTAATAWSARTGSSSNTSAASISVTDAASATSFTLDVDSLAKPQSVNSAPMTAGGLVGAGTLTLRTGTWAAGVFTPGGASADVTIAATASDTVATLAAKINSANAGVVATAFNDGTSDRLLVRSKETGTASGFRIQATTDADGVTTDNFGLSRLAFDPKAGAFGMASAGLPVQYGSNANARINGLAVTSQTNTLNGNIPGVTINLAATTTTNYGLGTEVLAPVTLSVREDVTPAVKSVQGFVTAYNALAASLADLTKYDAATKTASIFQGDSAVLGLQNVLRSMVGSISLGSNAYQRLSDVGIQRQLDGSLTINTAKLGAAANNGTELQKMFTTDNHNAASDGFALKFSALAKGVLASGGLVTNKADSLRKALARNATEQTQVTNHAAAVEARLRKQYTALDAQMANLSALNAYVAQQVIAWNKSTA
ncbi:MAG: flagellar filament capping protein FliD [Burkholderiales bacterium]|nr:flagellar filament capping protein FliD [Burkholderiales bacterium]